MFVIIAMVLFAACGAGAESDAEAASAGEFSPPANPGLDTYRMAIFTPDWRLVPLQPVDWETALKIPSVGLAYDDQGHITEAAGLWRGRRSDNVLVAEHPPLLRFSYSEGSETITFHYADGTPFSMQGVYGYSIIRDEVNGTPLLSFLGEDMEAVPSGGVIWGIKLRPDGEGWFDSVQMDSAGAELLGPDVVHNRYLLNDEGRVAAIEMLNSAGERLPMGQDIYRIEISYDTNGNIVERKRLDENGTPVENSEVPGWQTYQISEEGLTLGFEVLDPDGNPAEDSFGNQRGEFIYDQYGRLLENRSYDAEGEPVVVGGIYFTRIEYNDAELSKTVTKYGPDEQPVELSGIASTVMHSDSVGNVIDISYWDAEGEPARDPIGVHRYTYSFDEHSRRVSLEIWEPEGEPGVSSQGHHSEEFVYDENGVFQYTRRYDLEGQPLE
ncbi:MAG: hypothetical protein GF388_08085 [Candidatus Aegiribacteria sp.]|nr:hypothetical protein [Candidatus Aegiribacteria sp.]MBD3295047.1 hypothetical protein [Candidatus Fermentibacteria bacterium]